MDCGGDFHSLGAAAAKTWFLKVLILVPTKEVKMTLEGEVPPPVAPPPSLRTLEKHTL